MDLPNQKRPCRNCPFRIDSMKGWLGEKRMSEILKARSFTCHKNNELQCAGHMLINDSKNDFVQLADRLNINLELSGKELVFKNHAQCIKHHGTKLGSR